MKDDHHYLKSDEAKEHIKSILAKSFYSMALVKTWVDATDQEPSIARNTDSAAVSLSSIYKSLFGRDRPCSEIAKEIEGLAHEE